MNRISTTLALLFFGLGRPALAQEASPVAPVQEPPVPAPEPSFTEPSEWGWLLIGSSLALGAALALNGLSEDCHGERDCRVRKSQLIWGGIGVGSMGSMFGFIILENARDFEHAQAPSAGVVTVRGSF